MSEIRVTSVVGENGGDRVGLTTGLTVGPLTGTTGIGATITHQGHAQFAGVCTATSFVGNGSNLTGLSSGLDMVDSWRLTTNITSTTEAYITSNWAKNSDNPISGGYPHMGAIGSAMTESSGVFSFPSTGIYLVKFHCTAGATSGRRFFEANIAATRDNFSTTQMFARGYNNGYDSSNTTLWTSVAEGFFDVKDSNHKVKFQYSTSSNVTVYGANYNQTYVMFMRLGDT